MTHGQCVRRDAVLEQRDTQRELRAIEVGFLSEDCKHPAVVAALHGAGLRREEWGLRTRMLEMSWRMSMTSRAACRLEAASSADMLKVCSRDCWWSRKGRRSRYEEARDLLGVLIVSERVRPTCPSFGILSSRKAVRLSCGRTGVRNHNDLPGSLTQVLMGRYLLLRIGECTEVDC